MLLNKWFRGQNRKSLTIDISKTTDNLISVQRNEFLMDLKLYETAGVPQSVRTFALQAEGLVFESHPRQTEVEKPQIFDYWYLENDRQFKMRAT